MTTMTRSRQRLNASPKRLAGVLREAPWRAETRKMALLGVLGVFAFMLAGMYVHAGAQADIEFRNEQNLLSQRETLFFEVKRLEADLASEYAYDRMLQRAYALGYVPQANDAIEYVIVPPVASAADIVPAEQPVEIVPTETLLEWAIRVGEDLFVAVGG